jgi:hypothetical protein
MFRGDNYLEQLSCILDVLGTPSDEDMAFIPSEPVSATVL